MAISFESLDYISDSSRLLIHRLEERDPLIAAITHFCEQEGLEQGLKHATDLIREHSATPEAEQSELSRIVSQTLGLSGKIGTLHIALNLNAGYKWLKESQTDLSLLNLNFEPSKDQRALLLHLVRHILNACQILTWKQNSRFPRLFTFDGDGTLYDDGHNWASDSPLLNLITEFIRKENVHSAIITASSYPGNIPQFQARFQEFLTHISQHDDTVLKRFEIFGGECNYHFSLERSEGGVNLIESPVNKDGLSVVAQEQGWSPEGIEQARLALHEYADSKAKDDLISKIGLRIKKKERAVGFYVADTKTGIPSSQLDSLSLSMLEELKSKKRNKEFDLPFCCFNGGESSGIWIDIGNKSLSIKHLKNRLNINSDECVHFGDQFSVNGNDYSTRSEACTIWVTSPKETQVYLTLLSAYYQ